jgi:hypothetical protein
MKTQLIRGRGKAAAVALGGIATLAVAACSPAQANAAAGAVASANAAAQQQVAVVAAANVPVVVDCAAQGQVRPGQYTLACGDGGGYLSGLHWAAWGSSAAFADGTSTIAVDGHGASFPVLVDLWRAEPRPGHAGQRYFTRLTLVFTGNRSYTAGGTVHQFPPTVTYPLSAFGGA